MQLSLFRESQEYLKYINAAQAKALNNLVFLGYEVTKTKKLDHGYIEAQLRLFKIDLVGDWYETESHSMTLHLNRYGDITRKFDEFHDQDAYLICQKDDPLRALRLLVAHQHAYRRAYAHILETP